MKKMNFYIFYDSFFVVMKKNAALIWFWKCEVGGGVWGGSAVGVERTDPWLHPSFYSPLHAQILWLTSLAFLQDNVRSEKNESEYVYKKRRRKKKQSVCLLRAKKHSREGREWGELLESFRAPEALCLIFQSWIMTERESLHCIQAGVEERRGMQFTANV